MSRLLDDLSQQFRPLAIELLARLVEAGIPVLIVDTLRTLEEQTANVARGVSWTMNSKHLPQPPDSKALAIDIAPYEVYQLHGPDKLKWDETDPVWQKMGAIGEKLGLKWGIVIDGKRKDLGHFEMKVRSGPVPRTDGFVA